MPKRNLLDPSSANATLDPVSSEIIVSANSALKIAEMRVAQWASMLPIRSELHLIRKLWHMTMGVVMASLYIAGMPQSVALAILIPVFIWSLSMEIWRLRNPSVNEKCVRFFSGIMRKNEVHRISGVPYYIASALVAVAVFPRPVVVLSILFLAVGDPIASLVGILYKKRSVEIVPGKSLHGTAAGFLACALVAGFYLHSIGMYGLDLLRLSLLGGFAGAVAELLPLEIDDNFSIPMVSGLMMWIGFIAIHFV